MKPASPQPNVPVIEMIGVTIMSRRALAQVAVAEVNWTVATEDFWVIGGLQDSGKSDLLATAAALAKPQSGTYRLFGQEIAPTYDNECLAERRRVALVFGEGGRLFNHLTARDNVALPLHYHQRLSAAETEMRVASLLEATEITTWADLPPSFMNQSRRQRVALARALALKPEVLLLDNPLAGLDPRETRWWTDFLNQLHLGHPLLDHRPMAIIVAADDLRSWRQPNRKFAFLENARFTLLDDPFTFVPPPDHILRELLASETNPS